MLNTFDFIQAREMLRMAYQVATETSDDPNTQNGAILLIRKGNTDALDNGMGVTLFAGSNRLPDQVKRMASRVSRENDAKYKYLEHAERDAIFNAWKAGFDLTGAIMFCPWYACADCARVIAVSGIQQVIGHKAMFDRTPDSWKASIEAGNEILDDHGVVRHLYDGPIGGCSNLFRDEVWTP